MDEQEQDFNPKKLKKTGDDEELEVSDIPVVDDEESDVENDDDEESVIDEEINPFGDRWEE